MRSAPAGVADIIAGGSAKMTLTGDILHGTERIQQDIEISAWSLYSDYDAEIKSGGTVSLLYADAFAESIAPHELGDALAPFGTEVHLYMSVAAESVSGRISMGKFRVDSVPAIIQAQTLHRGRVLTAGEVITLGLLDRFGGVKRANFRSLSQPASLDSAWDEIARVSGLSVKKTVPDAVIPSTLVYPRSRLETVQLLAQVLGGRAYMTEEGAVGVLPDAYGSVVATLTTGPTGSVADLQPSMDSEDVANVVVGDFEDEDGAPIHVEAEVDGSHPLAVSRVGEMVKLYERSDKELIKTAEAAQAAVDQELARSAQLGAYVLPVQVRPNPLLEVWDVVEVQTASRIITGAILTNDLSKAGPQSLRLAVISDAER